MQLSDSGFLFDPATGHTFSLNATAIRVFDLLRQRETVAHVAATIAREAVSLLTSVDAVHPG